MKDIEVFDTITLKFLPTNYFGKLSSGRRSCGIFDRNGVVYITGGYKLKMNRSVTELVQGVETFSLKSRIRVSRDSTDVEYNIKEK